MRSCLSINGAAGDVATHPPSGRGVKGTADGLLQFEWWVEDTSLFGLNGVV